MKQPVELARRYLSLNPVPPTPEMLDALNPFAVALRYDLIEMESLDRNQTRKIVETVRRWAGDQIR